MPPYFHDGPIDFWDLDHTLLNTVRGLFLPVIQGLARDLALPFEVVEAHFVASCNHTFTFHGWLELTGAPIERRQGLEAVMREDVARRAGDCLFLGIVEVLQRRHKVARQVLITAGDQAFQSWKLELLTPILPFFAIEDRHFVPINPRGSKAAVIALYECTGRKAFVDDSADWHVEAQAQGLELMHIRPQWRDSYINNPHSGDGELWHVTTNAEELMWHLEGDV
jgi:hypothetical protein